MIESRHKTKILAIVEKHQPACTVYLFGSRARGDASTSSDIDLALDSGNKIDFKTICRIKEDLENTTIPYFIDVIDVHNVDEKFLLAIKPHFIKLEK